MRPGLYSRHSYGFFVLLAISVFAGLTACSQAVFQSDAPAFPTFNLVGAPTDRDVTYELRITGEGMAPIIRTGIGPTSGSLRLEVPAGQDRTFELLAENDVYSGVVTRSLAGGRENRVTVPILPGPIFLNVTDGPDERQRGIVQIRDLEATTANGTIRQIIGSDISPVIYNGVRVFYLSDGRAVFFTEIFDEGDGVEFYVFSDFAADSITDGVQLNDAIGLDPSAAPHPSRNTILVAWVPFGEPQFGFAGLDVIIYESSVNPDPDVTFFMFGVGPEVFSVQSESPVFEAIAVDFDDIAWLAISAVEFDGEEIVLVGVDIDSETVVATASIVTDVSFAEYALFPGPPRVDLHVSGNNVYMILSGTTSTHPPVFRYAIDTGVVTPWDPTTESEPEEFWGPRQFVSNRRDELIVIDQKDNDGSAELNGAGRLVRFQFGTTDGWETFGEGEFGFFDTTTIVPQ